MTSTEFPRRELAFEEQASGSSLLLKRNCSISPGGMLRVFGLLALASLGIALGNALEAAVGADLVRRFARGREAMRAAHTVVTFTLAAALATELKRGSLALAEPILEKDIQP